MSSVDPEPNVNDSRASRPSLDRPARPQIALLLRGFLAISGVAGSVLLILATTATVIRIRVLSTPDTASGLDTTLSGSDRHGLSLVIIAVFAAVMLFGALRGARPAMLALAAAGALTLAIAIVGDARHIHETGEVGQLYESASAGAGPGFHFETLGGALLLVAGGGLLLLSGGAAPRSRLQPGTDADKAGPDDWFATT